VGKKWNCLTALRDTYFYLAWNVYSRLFSELACISITKADRIP